MYYLIVGLLFFRWLSRQRTVMCETCHMYQQRKHMYRAFTPGYPRGGSVLRCKDPDPFSITEEFAPCRHPFEIHGLMR